MKIVPLKERYFKEIVEEFVKEYSLPNYAWDRSTAEKYLRQYFENYAKYCLVAVDERDRPMGWVLSRRDPYYQGYYLFINPLQVKQLYRGRGVGKALFKKLIEIAKRDKIDGIYLLADKRVNFPLDWYQRLGFEKSGWAEYEARLKDLKL